jgi:hypothetical protein
MGAGISSLGELLIFFILGVYSITLVHIILASIVE